MLSYRHAFHAGNHADVLKHLVLLQLLDYLTQKDKALYVIDTHAGAGAYDLKSDYAKKLAEFQGGIGRLWEVPPADLPPALADYVARIRQFNGNEANGPLRLYPGSPWLAQQGLRDIDRLRLYELHSTDARLLAANFKDAGRQVQVTSGDGLAGMKALLPPPSRRALVLIDPSYEVKTDYATIYKSLQDALQRFATGTYAVWYPCLNRPESRQFADRLKRLPAKDWLHVSLHVRSPDADGFGMAGSGMFILNPPWTLAATLKEVLPRLVELLAEEGDAGKGAHFVLESDAGGTLGDTPLRPERARPTVFNPRGSAGFPSNTAGRKAPRAPAASAGQKPGRPAGKPGNPPQSPRNPAATPRPPRKGPSGRSGA